MSEAIQDEAYLLVVFRYILNNPQKAGICPASEYEWSSYDRYEQTAGMLGMGLLHDLIGDRERYVEFIAVPNDDKCMEYEAAPRDDDWARKVIRKRLRSQKGTVLQSWDKSKRDAALRQLIEEGLSIRQIERLTGIGRGIIQRVKR